MCVIILENKGSNDIVYSIPQNKTSLHPSSKCRGLSYGKHIPPNILSFLLHKPFFHFCYFSIWFWNTCLLQQIAFWNYLKRDSQYSNVKIWDSSIWLIFHCVFYVTNAVFWKDHNSQKNNINICIEHWIMWSACSRALLIHNLLFDCCKRSLKWFLYPPTCSISMSNQFKPH